MLSPWRRPDGKDGKAEHDQQPAEHDREESRPHAQRGTERITARHEDRGRADGDQHQPGPDVLVVGKRQFHEELGERPARSPVIARLGRAIR